jgi:hypothetical protein
LFELTKAEDVEGLQNLAANMAPAFGVPDFIISPAILLAATRGSIPMVEILSEWTDRWSTNWSTRWKNNIDFYPGNKEFYSAVMKGNNPDLLFWFLEKLLFSRHNDFDNYGWIAGEAVATGSPDMYAAWEDFLLDPNRGLKVAYPCYAGDPDALLNDGRTTGKWSERTTGGRWYYYQHRSMKGHYRRSVLFSSSAFGAAKKNALSEARLIQTWHKLINNVLGGRPLDRRFLGCALVGLAQLSNPSITLGAELLRLGAPIDFPRGAGSNLSKNEADRVERVVEVERDGRRRFRQKTPQGMTPLHFAARKTSEQASHFLRFLLEQGADPEYAWADKKPVKEPGVALMKKWLGETWEEVVERTKEARLQKERLTNEEYSDSSDDGQDEIYDDSENGGEEQEVEEIEDEPGEARRRSSEQRAARAAKRRKLD